jgi:adenylate cyclase
LTDRPDDPAPRRAAREIAEDADVEVEFVDRLVALGIVSTEGGNLGGDVRRAQIAHALETAGLPLDGIAEAVSRGYLSLDFIDQPSYVRYASLTDETFADASTRTGVPIELLLVIREAMGFAPGSATDRLRADELAVVPFVEFMVTRGFRTPLIERTLRVTGDSLRRIADTEADWFNSEILRPLLAAGKSMTEVGHLTAELSTTLDPITDRALLAIYHGQQSHTWLRNIFEGFETTLAAGGLHRPVEHPPAVCFLDLTGYTRLTDERGDEAAAQLAERLGRLVQRTSVQYGGRPVKWLGDGVMFWFREPGPAVVAALEMVAGAAGEGLPPAHVGLHAGPVLFQEGDYFGRTVNIAARIAEYARQGEVLVSADVVEASTSAGMTFREIGPVELKGMSEPIRLYVAAKGT